MGFPKEDSLESRFYVARGSHETVRLKVVTARKAARELQLAMRNVRRAEGACENALFDARNHFFHFDGAVRGLHVAGREIELAMVAWRGAADAVQPKSREVEAIKRKASEALEQAKPVTASIPSNRESYVSAAESAQAHLSLVRGHGKDFLEALKQRERTGLQEMSKTARILEDARQMLMHERMGIFEEVAGFGQAAPSYHECCDRAEGFCELPPPPPPLEEDGQDGAVSPLLPDYEDAVGIERNDGGARAVSPLEETAATNALDGNSRTASA